jgi:RNA polymerase sigma-70 factor (ECF subfamily)
MPGVGVGSGKLETGTALVDDHSDLIGRAAHGDLAAYRQCIELYSSRVYAVAYQMVGNADDAQDIAQEVFLRLFQSLDKYRPTSRFTTWLYRLTVNLCIDYQRKNARHRQVTIEEVPNASAIEDGAPPPDAHVERRELRGAIDRLARDLTPQQRSVFVLRDLQGFETEEAARILKCRQSTVRVHLAKARAKIRQALMTQYPELLGGRGK